MSITITDAALQKELTMLNALMNSVSRGGPAIELDAHSCGQLILSYSRLGLIDGDKKIELLEKSFAAYEEGLKAGERNNLSPEQVLEKIQKDLDQK